VRRAFLIYNPASGRRRAKRTTDIVRVLGGITGGGP